MNAEFKKWLLDDSKHWSPEAKKEILRMAKFEPEQLVKNIADNLVDWGTIFCLQKGRAMFSYDSITDAKELVEVYKIHFADELATIT